jgi:hypothetical protein
MIYGDEIIVSVVQGVDQCTGAVDALLQKGAGSPGKKRKWGSMELQ